MNFAPSLLQDMDLTSFALGHVEEPLALLLHDPYMRPAARILALSNGAKKILGVDYIPKMPDNFLREFSKISATITNERRQPWVSPGDKPFELELVARTSLPHETSVLLIRFHSVVLNCGAIRLSQRERQIIALMEKGLGNYEIAESMKLKYNTIRTYNRRLFSKLKVKSRLAAISRYRKLRSGERSGTHLAID